MKICSGGVLFLQVYYQGDNILCAIYQSTPSVIQNQCVSVFCGLISHTSFTYIYAKPQPLIPWNIDSLYKEHCFIYIF